jgi:hypothetical protein
MQTPAETIVESNKFDTSVSSAPENHAWDPSNEEAKSPTGSTSPTNLSQARVGNANCWGTLKTLQDTIVESTKKKSDLSSKYAGGARIGVTNCWSKLSTFAWDMSMPVLDENRHSAQKAAADDSSTSATINVERLRAMAENSVKAPEMPTPEEEGANRELVVETIGQEMPKPEEEGENRELVVETIGQDGDYL